jgi:hypothetical protein
MEAAQPNPPCPFLLFSTSRPFISSLCRPSEVSSLFLAFSLGLVFTPLALNYCRSKISSNLKKKEKNDINELNKEEKDCCKDSGIDKFSSREISSDFYRYYEEL